MISVWLDDNRPAPEGWKWAKTAEQAKLYLITRDVENLSLDYDLDMPDCSQCQFECGHREGSCKASCRCHEQGLETGMDLMLWMVKSGKWPHKKPVVHSANPENGTRMQVFIDQVYPGPA